MHNDNTGTLQVQMVRGCKNTLSECNLQVGSGILDKFSPGNEI